MNNYAHVATRTKAFPIIASHCSPAIKKVVVRATFFFNFVTRGRQLFVFHVELLMKILLAYDNSTQLYACLICLQRISEKKNFLF